MRSNQRARRTPSSPQVAATAGVALCVAGLAGCSPAEQKPAAPPATAGGAIDRTVLPVDPARPGHRLPRLMPAT